ncbi:MAG TPA: DUF6174 domain-containing protein [Roseiflexaceae bacterium]|nr:DUF6174 domain-containing protein [Roseiflexaceae bacterium]
MSLALCLALVFGCGLGVLWLRPAPSVAGRAYELAAARDRWLSRTITHYRLVMQAPSWCRLDVEIKGEKVVRVFENSCPTSPRTVSGLFDMIKQLDSTADMVFCAPLGCECTEVRYVYARYDQELGFPRIIRLRRDRQMNWPELWHFLTTHGVPNCLTPRDIELVEVVSLNPIS